MPAIYVNGVKTSVMGTSGVSILNGTSDPASSQGIDGQLYLKYGNYIYKSFYDGAIVVRENIDDSTDVKLFVNGLSRSNTDLIVISDSDLLSYLTDITSGKFKGCDCYSQDKTTQYAFLIQKSNNDTVMNLCNSAISSRITGPVYGGMVDLNKAPVTSAYNYQINGYQVIGAMTNKRVNNALLRKNDTWQDLIGSDIDDVILNVGGGSDINYKTWAKFNGVGIILPYKINSDYKVSVTFYETAYNDDTAVIGNTSSASYSNLTIYSNQWYTSSGTSLVSISAWSGNAEHTFITNNGNSHNEFDETEVTSYTPTDSDSIYYCIGCRDGSVSSIGFKGYLKSYMIEKISDGSKVCEIKPAIIHNAACLYDSVNDIMYMPTGLTVVDTIPT